MWVSKKILGKKNKTKSPQDHPVILQYTEQISIVPLHCHKQLNEVLQWMWLLCGRPEAVGKVFHKMQGLWVKNATGLDKITTSM